MVVDEEEEEDRPLSSISFCSPGCWGLAILLDLFLSEASDSLELLGYVCNEEDA